MPELHETRVGRAFFERDVPQIARALTRIADALERIASAGDQPGARAAHPTATTAPAEGEDPRGAGADEPRTES